MATKKTVLMPIVVPAGDYCWNGEQLCEHFDNEGGHPTCEIKSSDLKYCGGCVFKPDWCRGLKEGGK